MRYKHKILGVTMFTEEAINRIGKTGFGQSLEKRLKGVPWERCKNTHRFEKRDKFKKARY